MLYTDSILSQTKNYRNSQNMEVTVNYNYDALNRTHH